MINEGLKLTYSIGKIVGVKNSIKFEVGDIVWCYRISESYRNQHLNKEYYRKKCKIIEVCESNDFKHFSEYGVEYIESGKISWWHYPTFLELISD